METKISDILEEKKQEIFSVTPDTKIFDTIKLMVEKNIGAVLVMEENRLAGIFTERDYMKKITLRGLSSKETPVKDVMTRQVAYISPKASLHQGLAVMSEKKCRHLPVFENKKLVGVISIVDLAKRMIKDQKVTINNLKEYIAGNW
ncbi:MAG: CBS domain-containing protein [Candidatus Aminicenantes bacterium]|jgi:CBS domain-containing protein